MCCLAEKSIPLRSRQGYSVGFQDHKPKKRLQDKAEEYFAFNSHGKFQFTKYFASENKQIVLIRVSGDAATAAEFSFLAKQWEEDTLYDSSLEAIWFHPAYQRIMAMGQRALPMILRELDKRLGHWFYALANIVRKDIGDGAANLEDARQRWLEWGRQNNLL